MEMALVEDVGWLLLVVGWLGGWLVVVGWLLLFGLPFFTMSYYAGRIADGFL